jgi:hypothetical protein
MEGHAPSWPTGGPWCLGHDGAWPTRFHQRVEGSIAQLPQRGNQAIYGLAGVTSGIGGIGAAAADGATFAGAAARSPQPSPQATTTHL